MKFQKKGNFGYMVNFSWYTRGPYIRNRVYIIIAFQLVNPINMDSDMVLLPLPLSF